MSAACWRPPFGAAEDRNILDEVLSQPDARLAAALRGGRGSQRLTPRTSATSRVLAAALRGGRGSQPLHQLGLDGEVAAGGRPSGRPRIATPAPGCSPPRTPRWRPPFGAAEDRNIPDTDGVILPEVWRPPFGAAEDRNPIGLLPSSLAGLWRPPFGAAEDRNPIGLLPSSLAGLWRPPFGAAEDRNKPEIWAAELLVSLAAALRGGRGSQPTGWPPRRPTAPPGGRPSGRPRIATRYLA